ncbi:phospholipase-like protein [Tanacetum coccineum]
MSAQSATPYWKPAFPSHPGGYNLQSPIPSHTGNQNLQPPIERHHDADGLFNQNILNRGKREQRPSFYKWTPYTKQPPTTILPKQHGNKNKNNVMKANLSPLNLGNAFDDENEGGDDVIYLGGKFTGNYLVYENVDPQKVKREHYVTLQEFLNDPKPIYLDCYMKGYLVPVTFWQQLVPHLCMPDIDSRTLMGWLSEEVFLPIHFGGNHWVTGVIDLPNAYVYVFDSLPNEGKRNLLWNQIQCWTPVVNNILQGREEEHGVHLKLELELLRKEKLYAKKWRVKLRRVRAMSMTIQSSVKDKILATSSETSKVENTPAKILCDLDQQMEKRADDGKENVVTDALSRKERVKPRRVRAMAMTIQYGAKWLAVRYLVKVSWNSKCNFELTWVWEDYLKDKYPRFIVWLVKLLVLTYVSVAMNGLCVICVYVCCVGYVRFDNQSIERDRLIGIGFVLDFVEFISFTFSDKEIILVIEAVSL